MKTTGFIKQHDNNKIAKDINKYLREDEINEDRDLILKYLEKGVLCVPFMGMIEDALDDDDDFIGYIAIYTDGVWFWPEYISAYIKKYSNFFIDEDFLKHIKNNQNAKIELTEEEILQFEKEYYLNEGFTSNE